MRKWLIALLTCSFSMSLLAQEAPCPVGKQAVGTYVSDDKNYGLYFFTKKGRKTKSLYCAMIVIVKKIQDGPLVDAGGCSHSDENTVLKKAMALETEPYDLEHKDPLPFTCYRLKARKEFFELNEKDKTYNFTIGEAGFMKGSYDPTTRQIKIMTLPGGDDLDEGGVTLDPVPSENSSDFEKSED